VLMPCFSSTIDMRFAPVTAISFCARVGMIGLFGSCTVWLLAREVPILLGTADRGCDQFSGNFKTQGGVNAEIVE